MIVNTFEEAKPIVLAAIAEGKKIGSFLPAGEHFHPGYEYICNTLREKSSFIVAQIPKNSRSEEDNEYKWLSLWPGMPKADPVLAHVDMPMEEVRKVEQVVDLVIRENVPVPDSIQEQREIINFTESVFVPEWSKYQPLNRNNYVHMTKVAWFASLYYMTVQFFNYDVTVNSYKEGLWRFVRKKVYERLLSYQVCIVRPIRDQYGLLYSDTRTRNLLNLRETLNENALRKLLNGRDLVTDPEETRESLQKRISRIKWEVMDFEKYSGELLEGSGGTVYVAASIFNPLREKKRGLTDTNYQEGVYCDAFLF